MGQAAPGHWVEQWLSPPRFGRYLGECDGDRAGALDLYEWNLKLSYAALRDIAHFEIALRNAFDRAITAGWRGEKHWLFDPESPVLTPLMRRSHGQQVDINRRNRKSVQEAVDAKGGANPAPDAIIAELPFGFWRHLADTGHDRTVWVPYLQRIWPPGTSRAHVYQVMTLVNETRNRAAHHEPFFGGRRGVLYTQQQLVGLLQLLIPDLAVYVRQTSTVATVLRQKP